MLPTPSQLVLHPVALGMPLISHVPPVRPPGIAVEFLPLDPVLPGVVELRDDLGPDLPAYVVVLVRLSVARDPRDDAAVFGNGVVVFQLCKRL